MQEIEEEIQLLGRRVTRLIEPPTALSKRERTCIRALLKQWYYAAQEAIEQEELLKIRDALLTLCNDLGYLPEGGLIDRLERHNRFGCVDVNLTVETDAVNQQSKKRNRLTEQIIERRGGIEDPGREENTAGEPPVNPLKTAQEEKELVRSKQR